MRTKFKLQYGELAPDPEIHITGTGKLTYLWIGGKKTPCYGFLSGAKTLESLANNILTAMKAEPEHKKFSLLDESETFASNHTTIKKEESQEGVSYEEYLRVVGATDNNTYARKIYERLIYNGYSISRKEVLQ